MAARRRRPLFGIGQDTKTIKGEAFGFVTGILYLAPHTLAGGKNLCAHSTIGCRTWCINITGKGALDSVQRARLRKTDYYLQDREAFMADCVLDLDRLQRLAIRRALRPLARPNGTSDQPWESIPAGGRRNLMECFPSIAFYDYTKNPGRMRRYLAKRHWPENYSLTFSRSECNERECLELLTAGANVAIPFSTRKGQPLPASWHGYPVTDGDVSDARPSDERGVIIGLRAKGQAKHDRTGFVVHVACVECHAPLRPEDNQHTCTPCATAWHRAMAAMVATLA